MYDSCSLIDCHFINIFIAPEPTMNGSNKSFSPISRTKETSPIPASRSRKTQGKEKAASPSGTTTKSVLPADDADESSSSDEGEEEVDDLEEEEELVSNKAVTTKRLVSFSIR